MDNSELKKVVDARSRLIRLYNKLDGKDHQFATVLQSDVAYEVSEVVKMIDQFLHGKVKFQ